MTPYALDRLSSLGVAVAVVPPGRLHLTTANGHVPDKAVRLARDYKPELVEHLRPCRPHNNPANYIDAEVQPGVIRTTCRVCGRFIGYRYLDPSDRTLIDETAAPRTS